MQLSQTLPMESLSWSAWFVFAVFGQLSQGDAPGDAPLAHSGTAVVTPSDTDLVRVLKAQLAAAEERERRLLGLLEQMALPAGRSAPAESTKPWWKWWA